jgi:hypothetical protein
MWPKVGCIWHVLSSLPIWYAFMLGVSLRADLYMTQKDQVFVVDVVVINLTQETMASSVIH